MTHELVRWLGEQLDEDERIARAAGGLDWCRSEHPWDTAVAIRDSKGERVVCDEGWPSEGQEVHIAEWDPARVLREIDAKRRLLADITAERHLVNDGDCWYTCAAATEERDGGETCDDTRHGAPCDCGRDARVERRLRLLALPYSDRPGYAEAIAPLN